MPDGVPLKEIVDMKVDCDTQTVQATAIVGLTVLGAVALIVDGSMGETIAVAVAAAFGIVVGNLFKKKEVKA